MMIFFGKICWTVTAITLLSGTAFAANPFEKYEGEYTIVDRKCESIDIWCKSITKIRVTNSPYSMGGLVLSEVTRNVTLHVDLKSVSETSSGGGVTIEVKGNANGDAIYSYFGYERNPYFPADRPKISFSQLRVLQKKRERVIYKYMEIKKEGYRNPKVTKLKRAFTLEKTN